MQSLWLHPQEREGWSSIKNAPPSSRHCAAPHDDRRLPVRLVQSGSHQMESREPWSHTESHKLTSGVECNKFKLVTGLWRIAKLINSLVTFVDDSYWTTATIWLTVASESLGKNDGWQRGGAALSNNDPELGVQNIARLPTLLRHKIDQDLWSRWRNKCTKTSIMRVQRGESSKLIPTSPWCKTEH